MIFVGIFIVAEPPHKLHIKTEIQTEHNIPYNENKKNDIEQQENINKTLPILIPKTSTLHVKTNPYSSGYTKGVYL